MAALIERKRVSKKMSEKVIELINNNNKMLLYSLRVFSIVVFFIIITWQVI